MLPENPDEVPMDPPQDPPFCDRCGLRMVVRKDRRTGRRAAHGWKAVLQCPRCRNVTIGQDGVAWGRRFKLIRGALVFASGALSLGETLLDLRNVDLRPEHLILLVLIAAVCLFTSFVVTCAAHGLSPQVPAKTRFEYWCLAAFWCGPLTLVAYALFADVIPTITAGAPAPPAAPGS